MSHGKTTGHKSSNGHTSPVLKRSIVIAGHKTSVSLEEPFWIEIKRIAADRNKGLKDGEQRTTLSVLVAEIDEDRVNRKAGNLSSALRLFVLGHVQAEAA